LLTLLVVDLIIGTGEAGVNAVAVILDVRHHLIDDDEEDDDDEMDINITTASW